MASPCTMVQRANPSYFNRMRLTACRSVSCYGGSAGRIALVGRVLEVRPPQADERASSRAGRFPLKK